MRNKVAEPTEREATAKSDPSDRSRRRLPKVGMWLHIQARHDKGGAPLIRVERIDSNGWVYVSDWLDFQTEAPQRQTLQGYTPPRERCFAFDADEFSKRTLKYWKAITPVVEPGVRIEVAQVAAS